MPGTPTTRPVRSSCLHVDRPPSGPRVQSSRPSRARSQAPRRTRGSSRRRPTPSAASRRPVRRIAARRRRAPSAPRSRHRSPNRRRAATESAASLASGLAVAAMCRGRMHRAAPALQGGKGQSEVMRARTSADHVANSLREPFQQMADQLDVVAAFLDDRRRQASSRRSPRRPCKAVRRSRQGTRAARRATRRIRG